ncbi:hypothetical protein Tco_0741496 [Tanacetum coccineum]
MLTVPVSRITTYTMSDWDVAVHALEDEYSSEEQPRLLLALPIADSQDYAHESNLKEEPEADDDEDPEEDPADYPANRDDDDQDHREDLVDYPADRDDYDDDEEEETSRDDD